MPLRLLLHMKPFHLRFVLLLLSYSILVVLNQRHHHVECHQRSIYPPPPPPQAGGPTQSYPARSSPSAREPLTEFVARQGGLIKEANLTLTKSLNPILIRRDIIIRRDARLTIEAGAELYFERQRGIIVQGTLEILGQPGDKVKLQLIRNPAITISNQQQQARHHQAGQQQQVVRLVDGDLPSEGRVQIKLNDRWHSLCTNSKNLTAADIRVLCRQAGYQEGFWYRWFPKRNDTTGPSSTIVAPEIMSKSFHCAGNELSLQQCRRWNRIRAGGGVCDNQSDIGIRCSRKLAPSITSSSSMSPFDDIDARGEQATIVGNYWRGIEFQESETQQEYILDGQMKQRLSRSKLRHLMISEAGLDDVGNATAAIRAFGQPPQMSHVQVSNSVYGIMVHECQDAVKLSNIKLVNNLAAPLFINTSYGKVQLDRLHVENNGGDGIRVARYERTTVGSHDFCKFANLGSDQTYPVILSHEQQFLRTGRDCCQEFISQNQQLTVHFPVLRSTPNNLLPETGDHRDRLVTVPAGVQLGRDAQLIIYDDYREEFPFKLAVRNNTRAQSIVSKTGRLKICYEPASYRTVLFTIEVVADVINGNSPADYDYGTGIAHDVEISNSFVAHNEGRGIWLDNLRAGSRILNTTVIQHNYLAGVHVENGTGEVIIQASYISNNTGHGIFIQQAGGYYHIDNSTISGNTARGISIEYDKRPELVPFNHTMHLGYSLVANNGDNGLFIGNVCRSDAFWNISMNSFIRNGEDAIYFQSCLASHDNVLRFNQMTSRLNTSNSLESNLVSTPGLPNYYKLQELYITHNVFLANQRRALRLAPIYFVKSFIRHNLFREHPLAVIYINNQDVMRSEHMRTLSNSTHLAPVNVRIASNRFYANRGRFVANVGLTEEGARQTLMFTKNYLEENAITEPYSDLRPRSRVSAVVVVSSSNVKVVRNRFDNPRSNYELGVHLEAHSKIINATANFWGFHLDASSIYKRIFDRKNRYNLAQVEFLQYLLSPEDLEYITDLSFDRERDKITTFRNGSRLGGEVKGYEELPAGTYTVQDDITVLPGSHLVIRDGVTLKFSEGVGLMNQGRLDALGKANAQIHFTSSSPINRLPLRPSVTTTTTQAPLASSWVSHRHLSADLVDLDRNQIDDLNSSIEFNVSNSSARGRHGKSRIRRQLGDSSSQVIANVRLSHTTMGRLEVQIDGVWGSVCDYNFDIHDAAVACQQLGMIINRDDWLLERSQYAVNDQQQLYESLSNDALMTNLRCDPTLDTDLTACKAEISLRGDFDGLCSSEVGIRCFPPSWSGVRFGMGAETSTLEHVTIQRAGMFDYAKYSLKPALQIDFNRHWLNSLVVRSNSDSGLGIMFNDVIGRHFSELAVNEGKFLNNERHGIELRSRGLTIRNCQMANNRQSGLDYNPSLTQEELDDLLSWLRTPKTAESVVTLNFASSSGNLNEGRQRTNTAQPTTFSVPSSEDSYRFFVIPANPQPELRETFTICTDPGHMLSMQVISPIHQDSTEMLNMSLGVNADGSSLIYDLRVNLTSFPMVSPGYKFHFNYTSGSQPLGNIILYVRSRYNNRDFKVLTKFIPQYLIMPKFDQTATNINSKLINSLVIANNTINKNGIGLKFRYPNYAHGPGRSIYNRRYSNETTNITDNTFDSNYFSAIYVGSDEYEQELETEATTTTTTNSFDTASSEIRFNLVGNKMRRNKDGVRQFSRDIRYSYNVFHWSINETTFEMNKGGGINLMLPYYWRYDTNLSHTIELNNNSFFKNANFDLSVDGHFGMLNITHNRFRENRCRNKLISVSGMEKRLLFRHNQIDYNICNRIVDVNIQSHADKLGSIPTYFEYNTLRHNRRLISNSTFSSLVSNFHYPRLLDKLHPHATDYALGLRGIQALNISRNLFLNRELRFDLVVAINMDPDERTVNAIENYWGSSRVHEIRERIFDFDDWNSYAVVEFSPFLIGDSFQAASMFAADQESEPSVTIFQGSNNLWMTSRPSSIDPRPPTQLGGRLTRSLILPHRKEPYVVESDLTVMPNVRLTIERGATLLFMPNVGMLILGELVAAGTRDRPIQMRPLLSSADVLPLSNYLFPVKVRPNITLAGIGDSLAHEHNYAFKHYKFTYPVDMGSLRLCKNEICHDGSHIYENNVEDPNLRREALGGADGTNGNSSWRMDGFLEIFNMTTLQWVPVCDPLFTEHTARVVCRQLGYSHLSLFKRGRRYTIEQEQVSSIKSWPRSIQCEGDESSLSGCPLAASAFMNHSTACQRDTNQFVYVYCRDFSDSHEPTTGATNRHQATRVSSEHLNHWGGIRFSCPSRQQSMSSLNDIDDQSLANGMLAGNRSRLQYVTIDRAGWLHRRRAPAVQVLQCNVLMEHVAISNSAYHGLELIASHANQNFHQLRIRNSLGLGLNYLSLTGSSSATRLVPYLPLKQVDLTNDIFGLVDVCGANKEIRIDERILLVFRYTSRPVDCVKIISSKLSVKHLGIRMLQFNLFNSSQLTPRPDHVRIYDGNVFDWDSRLVAELGVEERHRVDRPELKFYQSTDSTMTVRVHASGAGLTYGFIAEVVTTPVSYNIQRDLYNNMTLSEFTNNRLGAISLSSAGESTPNLIFKGNRFESNCLHLFGNFTSCVAPVHMELQNCQRLKLIDNLFRGNQAGGLMVKSYSHSAVAALEAQIERNVFEANQNTYSLALVGPKTDPYQRVSVISNFFTRNVARYLPNIVMSRIVANFSGNIVSSNVGKHQIEVIGFDKLPLSYQTFHNNWIYNNTATFERDQSTISCNSAGQQFRMNYLANPDNHFELSTRNWSRYDVRPFHVARDDEIIHLVAGDGSMKDMLRKNVDSIPLSIIDAKRLDLHQATINAEHNWWGFNATTAIQGRIRDRVQHEELIRVDFVPYLETNRSLLSGVCSGGWQRVNGACLVYIGTRMTYAEAREFCDRERATLPLLRGNHYEFTDFVASQDWAPSQFDARVERIWVRSFDVSREACPALNDYRTKNYDCQDRYAFLCEKDPQVVVTLLNWHRETGGLIAMLLALITIVLTCCCSACWVYKSRERHREKLERKSTLYNSMRSVRSVGAANPAWANTASSNNSLSEFFLHQQLYNTEKSSITDLSMSTQWTQPSNDETNLVRLDPAGVNAGGGVGQMKRYPSASRVQEQQQQRQPFHSVHPNNVLSLPRSRANQQFEAQQAAYNPSYVSPVPSNSRDAIDYAPARHKTPTPAPSYKEPHPRALKNSASRTPSLTGSYTNEPDQFSAAESYAREHMLSTSRNSRQQPERGNLANASRSFLTSTPDYDFRLPSVKPPPELSYQYSNIRFNPDPSFEAPVLNARQHRRSASDSSQNSQLSFAAQQRPQPPPEPTPPPPLQAFEDNRSEGQLYAARPVRVGQPGDLLMDAGSSSSAPTFYSNRTFDESTNSSNYLETYDLYNAYSKNLPQQQLNNDQISLVLTERSSVTDSIVNTRITESQIEYTMLPRPIQNIEDLAHAQLVAARRPTTTTTHDNQQAIYQNGHAVAAAHQRAASDLGGPAGSLMSRLSQGNLMETSFDLDSPTGAATFGGSQPLNPVSFGARPLQQSDSKSGSRVYLETSFE